jgi:hypothetical protein
MLPILGERGQGEIELIEMLPVIDFDRHRTR